MNVLDQIRREVEAGHPQETKELVRAAMLQGLSTKSITENAMLPGIKHVGEQLKTGEVAIPQLLSAARSVRSGFYVIEEITGEQGYLPVGKVILGTVEGDLHDIGKNLVSLIMKNQGIEVVDLGVDVTFRQFQQALKENPDVKLVCVSALLTTALPEMKQIIRKLKRIPNRTVYVMAGGGAVTEELAKESGADFFTEDAVDAAELARTFLLEHGDNRE